MRRFRRQELRVERFELVEVGPGLALVRLSGEWRSAPPTEVTLIARHGGTREELAPLPEPPGDSGGEWRAAFSAHGEALEAEYELHTADGRRVELPAPVPRGAPVAAAASRPKPTRLPPAIEDRPDSEAFRAVEEALRTERARAERTEASLREQLRIMVAETAEFMGRLEGYELRRAELEKELSWERLLHREARRTLAQVERDVDDAQHRAADMRRRVKERDELLGLVRASVEDGSTRLGDLEERLMELREAGEAADVPPGENGHEPAFSARQAAVLDRVRDEADRGLERLGEIEDRVVELRAAIIAAAASEAARPEPPRRRRRFLRA